MGVRWLFCPCLYRNRLFNTVIWAMITDVIDDAEVKKQGARGWNRVFLIFVCEKVRAGFIVGASGDDFSGDWISGTAYA